MMIENPTMEGKIEESKVIGQNILNTLLGYEAGFCKATLTLCLCTLINKNENPDDKVVDIMTITSLFNKICTTPTLH